MLDPAGNEIRIGWSETEMLWLRAASSLCLKDREEAWQDLAGLTGRTVNCLRRQARLLAAQDRKIAKAVLEVALRKNWLSESASASPRRVFVPERSRVRAARITGI